MEIVIDSNLVARDDFGFSCFKIHFIRGFEQAAYLSAKAEIKNQFKTRNIVRLSLVSSKRLQNINFSCRVLRKCVPLFRHTHIEGGTAL